MNLKEMFCKGVDFQEFISQDNDTNGQTVVDIYNSIRLDDDLIKSIKSIDKKINILGFAEIWCPDCIINVPAINKAIENNSNFDLKIVPREGNETCMEKYKLDGKIRIPTFVVLDDNFNELGVFVETPMTFKKVIKNSNEPEMIVAKRKYKKGDYILDTIEEVLQIINKD